MGAASIETACRALESDSVVSTDVLLCILGMYEKMLAVNGAQALLASGAGVKVIRGVLAAVAYKSSECLPKAVFILKSLKRKETFAAWTQAALHESDVGIQLNEKEEFFGTIMGAAPLESAVKTATNRLHRVVHTRRAF